MKKRVEAVVAPPPWQGSVPPPRASSTRRTEGVRNEGRAARVVADVLRGTAEQLSRVGFAALRIEDVAARSGVNKTTIYRRWPTRADLVAATLRVLKSTTLPDTGTLRGDVLAWVDEHDAFARSTVGSGIVRMIQTERAHPELEAILRGMREEQRALRRRMVSQAVERDELPATTNVVVVAELIFAPIAARLFIHGERVDRAYAEAVLDIVFRGAGGSTQSHPATKPAPKAAPDRKGSSRA